MDLVANLFTFNVSHIVWLHWHLIALEKAALNFHAENVLAKDDIKDWVLAELQSKNPGLQSFLAAAKKPAQSLGAVWSWLIVILLLAVAVGLAYFIRYQWTRPHRRQARTTSEKSGESDATGVSASHVDDSLSSEPNGTSEGVANGSQESAPAGASSSLPKTGPEPPPAPYAEDADSTGTNDVGV